MTTEAREYLLIGYDAFETVFRENGVYTICLWMDCDEDFKEDGAGYEWFYEIDLLEIDARRIAKAGGTTAPKLYEIIRTAPEIRIYKYQWRQDWILDRTCTFETFPKDCLPKKE